MMKRTGKKKVVVIGGGTGTYQVLVGLKRHPIDISAVISMSDSGGSTGKLRKELSILPPGDVRRALIALSNLPLAQKTLEKLFDFRFENGHSLKGHSLGNLLLAALIQITGREDLAIAEAGRILSASGYVYPVTLDKTDLVAVLENGRRIHGETKIDLRHEKNGDAVPIEKVYLSPKGSIFADSKKVIERADVIVLGPGDLYTSIIPNLLVRGVPEAIAKSRAKVVLVVNLMTKPGETDGFKVSDFIKTIKEYLREAQSKLKLAIVNNKLPDDVGTLAWYSKFHSEPVRDDTNEEFEGVKIIRGSFADKGEFVRHDPAKLAKVIINI
ncbi:MAG: YvcK family protein [bacterium]|nr:YvcK family protein [bacterium]